MKNGGADNMFKKIVNWFLYTIACLLSLYFILKSSDNAIFIYTSLIVSAILFLILPIKHLVAMLKTYYYSKFIKTILTLDENHYLFLAEHDESYNAMLIKMDKIIKYKNKK